MNVDALAMRRADSMTLITLVNRQNRTSSEAALIEFAVDGGERRVRLSLRDSVRALQPQHGYLWAQDGTGSTSAGVHREQ